jgi:hypothetical protein
LKRLARIFWANCEKFVGIAAIVLAVYAIVLAHTQLNDSNLLAWDYNGGAQCSDYRGEVLSLWEAGIRSEAQIRDWFIHEEGGATNPYGASSTNAKAIADFEEDCGDIRSLLARLPASPPVG